MSNVKKAENMLRNTLGALLLLIALNAFGGGYYGMSGARDVPAEWLTGSPFRDYFIPGLILFIAVGGSALIASVAVFKKHRLARQAALLCGGVILSWISVQLVIIGYVSWLQPVIAVAGILIILLTLLLPAYEH